MYVESSTWGNPRPFICIPVEYGLCKRGPNGVEQVEENGSVRLEFFRSRSGRAGRRQGVVGRWEIEDKGIRGGMAELFVAR